MFRLRLAPLLALTFVCATACEDKARPDDPKVPFKLNETKKADAPVEPTPEQKPVDAQAGTYAPPIDSPTLDGKILPLTIVRASLLVDLDGDGDRDVLALYDDPDARLHLAVSLRESMGFAAPRDMPNFPISLPATCSVEGARLEALSATKARASFDTACGEPSGLGPSHHVFLSLEAAPRVYEHLELAPRSAAGTLLTLAVKSGDADGDAHDDVQLVLTLDTSTPLGEGFVPSPLELALLDRPSGLVRDAREPETTLAAWASAALGAKSPDQAGVRALEVLTMRRALCREAGEPLITVGGTPGFACGPGKSSTEAALSLVIAQAKRGRVSEAFDAYRSLLRADPKPDAKSLEKAHAALKTLPSEPGASLREGPTVEALETAPLHLPAARFLDEGTLFLRRRAPVSYVLESGAETPAPEPADDLVRDPGGQLAVTSIERTCTGYVLRIERRTSPALSYVPAPPVALAPVLPLAAAPGCTSLPEAERKDTGGFRVLGWAPQGVVAARGEGRYVVPLDLEGRPSGEPRALPGDAPAPAPLPPGPALPDGSMHVEATRFGVLLYRAQGVILVRPEGYEAAVGTPSDAAVSPSGKRIAVVSGGKVFLVTRGASGAP